VSGATRDRLAFNPNPVRQFFSPTPWTATAYLVSYAPVAAVLFVVALVTPLIAVPACLTWLGLPLLVVAAWVLRCCAQVERFRSLLVGPRIRGDYRPGGGGLLTMIRRIWTDPATWHDAGYLIGLYVPLLILDAAVTIVWAVLLGLLVSPAWFWAVPQTFDNGVHAHGLSLGYLPDGPNSSRGWGIWIGSVPAALLTAVVAAIAALGFCYVLIAAARLHRYAAHRMLGPRVDPLAEVRAILSPLHAEKRLL
jgi:Putative sensor